MSVPTYIQEAIECHTSHFWEGAGIYVCSACRNVWPCTVAQTSGWLLAEIDNLQHDLKIRTNDLVEAKKRTNDLEREAESLRCWSDFAKACSTLQRYYGLSVEEMEDAARGIAPDGTRTNALRSRTNELDSDVDQLIDSLETAHMMIGILWDVAIQHGWVLRDTSPEFEEIPS